LFVPDGSVESRRAVADDDGSVVAHSERATSNVPAREVAQAAHAFSDLPEEGFRTVGRCRRSHDEAAVERDITGLAEPAGSEVAKPLEPHVGARRARGGREEKQQ